MDEKRIAEIREHCEKVINAFQQILEQLEQAQKEIERLKDINSALENDLINANMNLERLTERVETQRWIPVSERLTEYNPSGTVKSYLVEYDTSKGK